MWTLTITIYLSLCYVEVKKNIYKNSMNICLCQVLYHDHVLHRFSVRHLLIWYLHTFPYQIQCCIWNNFIGDIYSYDRPQCTNAGECHGVAKYVMQKFATSAMSWHLPTTNLISSWVICNQSIVLSLLNMVI